MRTFYKYALAAVLLLWQQATVAQTWTVTPSPGGLPVYTPAQSGGQDQLQITFSSLHDGIIYTWRDARGVAVSQDIYVQKMTPCGATVWTAAGVSICNAASNQQEPQICPDGAGGAIVTWMDTRGTDWDIYAQHVDNNGSVTWTANGVAVCASTGDQQHPVITSDGSGGAIIAWEDTRSGNRDIYAQRLNASGAPQWTANGIAVCQQTGTQEDICIETDSAGGAFLAWEDSRPVANGLDIYGERISSAGSAMWATPGSGIALTSLSTGQVDPDVCNTGSANPMFIWSDPNGSGQNIKALKLNGLTGAAFNANWAPPGGVIVGVAITSSGNPGTAIRPKIVTDNLGGAYVSFRSTYSSSDKDILSSHVDGTSALTLNCPSCWNYGGYFMETTAFGTVVEDYHDLAPTGCGGAVNVWDVRNNGPNYVQYRTFGSGGTTTAANGGSGSGNSDDAKITANCGVYYLGWEDSRTGTLGAEDIYAGATSALASPAILNLTGTTSYNANQCCLPTNSVTACQGTSLTFTCPGPSGLFSTFTFRDGVTVLQTGSSTSYTTSALSLGTHTITVVASTASACSTNSSNSFVITVSAAATLSPGSVTNVSCFGGSNGSAAVSASGGVGPYTYLWAPSGGTGATATGLTAGTYTCTVTTAPGCTSTLTAMVTEPAVITAPGSSTPATCGGNNGTASVAASGGTPGYTYSWTPSGGTASTETGLVAGNYTCTVTDANGCTITEAVPVSNAGGPVFTASVQANVSCNAGTDGSATTTITSGTGPFTYSWSPSGGTAATATGLAAGTYTCTVTDANNCVQSQTVTITEPAAITSSAVQTDVLCNAGTTGAATVTAGGGTPSYTYSWAPSGGTAATASGLMAGSYTCTITDGNSCVSTQTVTITEPTAVSATSSQSDVSCNGGSNGTASVVASGGTPGYTYSWSPSGGTGSSANLLAASSYTCTITDASGCTSTSSFVITEPAPIGSSYIWNDATCGNNNGDATVTGSGGTGPYVYYWPSSGTVAATDTSMAAGIYTCIITDANGCVDSISVTINNFGAPLVSLSAQTDVSCFGGATGTATVAASGGTSPYTYNWTPSGGTAATATGLTAGTYTCTVTDAGNCVQTQTVTITEPPALAPSVTSTGSTCNGSNGSATVTVTGGTGSYTYNWLPSGGTAATATSLASGTYSCVITDGNSCSDTATVVVASSGGPSVASSSQVDLTCSNSSNGSATVTASGGTGPYTYSWTPSGGTAATASGLSAGSYTCTITDANNCTTTQSFTITAPAAVAGAAATTNISCNGGSNGSSTITPSGGTGPYTYNWTPSGGTAATASSLGTGSYTCTITDANGCTGTQIVTITEPAAIAVTSTTSPGCGTGSGGASAAATGGTGIFTYAWTPSGGSSPVAANLADGTYTCTATDANGCTATTVVTITNFAAATAAITGNTSITIGTSTALTATGGIVYAWSPPLGLSCLNCANPTASPASTTTYCVDITDANGCSDSACVTITVDGDCGEVMVPNAFSPNSDGSNDVLCIYGKQCISEVEFVIYDRWGEKVFTTTDPNACWDGTMKGGGEVLTSAVFVYYLRATLLNGETVTRKGNVSLVY
ncbi:MAG: hypothetical protein FD123_89 [Bacteroidetes bacterium]|nr:MAG: hypothetical protein FD123_89 [Bacteroidota bacterium]